MGLYKDVTGGAGNRAGTSAASTPYICLKFCCIESLDNPEAHGSIDKNDDEEGADDISGGKTEGRVAEPLNWKGGRFSPGASSGKIPVGRGMGGQSSSAVESCPWIH